MVGGVHGVLFVRRVFDPLKLRENLFQACLLAEALNVKMNEEKPTQYKISSSS